MYFHIKLAGKYCMETTTLASSLDCSNLNLRRHKVEVVFAFGVIRQCAPQRRLWHSCAQLMANAMQLDLDSFTARWASKSQRSELSPSASLPNSTTTKKIQVLSLRIASTETRLKQHVLQKHLNRKWQEGYINQRNIYIRTQTQEKHNKPLLVTNHLEKDMDTNSTEVPSLVPWNNTYSISKSEHLPSAYSSRPTIQRVAFQTNPNNCVIFW